MINLCYSTDKPSYLMDIFICYWNDSPKKEFVLFNISVSDNEVLIQDVPTSYSFYFYKYFPIISYNIDFRLVDIPFSKVDVYEILSSSNDILGYCFIPFSKEIVRYTTTTLVLTDKSQTYKEISKSEKRFIYEKKDLFFLKYDCGCEVITNLIGKLDIYPYKTISYPKNNNQKKGKIE